MSARRFGQTKITATAPLTEDAAHIKATFGATLAPVASHLVVETRALRNADPQAYTDLQTLLAASIVRKGGDPERITWTAEPIGPQIELAAVNGRTL